MNSLNGLKIAILLTVVQDGNLITSRNSGDILEFNKAIIEQLSNYKAKL